MYGNETDSIDVIFAKEYNGSIKFTIKNTVETKNKDFLIKIRNESHYQQLKLVLFLQNLSF